MKKTNLIFIILGMIIFAFCTLIMLINKYYLPMSVGLILTLLFIYYFKEYLNNNI